MYMSMSISDRETVSQFFLVFWKFSGPPKRKEEEVGGRGRRPCRNKALFQTCRKQGSLCCDAGGPSYVWRCYRKDAISTSALGRGGGCIGLQCYTKYPGALTSLMKSLLAATTHYCTFLCLSHGDLSLYLFLCLFVSLAGWLLKHQRIAHWEWTYLKRIHWSYWYIILFCFFSWKVEVICLPSWMAW